MSAERPARQEPTDPFEYGDLLVGSAGSFGRHVEAVASVPQAVITTASTPSAVAFEDVVNPLAQYLEGREAVDPAAFIARFKSVANYQRKDKGIYVAEDIYGLKKTASDGEIITYTQTLEKARKATGRECAAEFGVGKHGKKEFVLFNLDYNFLRGSVGSAEGEVFVNAVEYAIHHKIPFMGMYPSGGMRMHEGFDSLMQMPKFQAGLIALRRKGLKYLPILMNTWGGTDVIGMVGYPRIGVKDTQMGFTGRRVTKSFTFQEPPPQAYTAEQNFIQGNVDALVTTPEELHEYSGKIFKSAGNRKRLSEKGRAVLPSIPDRPLDRLSTATPDFFSPLLINRTDTQAVIPRGIPHAEDPLLQEYLTLLHDPRMPDFDFLLRHAATNVVRLYNEWTLENTEYLPKVVGAYGDIGEETFLWIGTPVSRRTFSDEKSVKMNPNLAAKNYETFIRLLQMAKEEHRRVITFSHVFGAMAHPDEEDRGLPGKISEAIDAALLHPTPIISVVEYGASGGDLPLLLGDYLIILENGQLTVAEGMSAAAIHNGTEKPSHEEIAATMHGMRVTAEDMHNFGFAQKIIPETEGGGVEHPGAWAESIRNGIADAIVATKYREGEKLISDRLRKYQAHTNVPLKSRRK